MFECLVCNDRATDFRYGTRYKGDFIPLCSRRCRQTFLVEPEQFFASLEELVFAR